ncbi:MAG: radical SAM protein [bacterium]|nr:radical SAM protein [bacterium]
MPDLEKEIRYFPASDPGPEPIHVGVMYPNTYPVSIASLGFQIIHRIIHQHPGIIAHRICLENDGGKSYPTKTLEENLEIKSLDVIAISCSFELDYLHLVRTLHASGIPVLRKNRGSLPLILIGGIAPTANPEPLALIADAIFIGNAEINLASALDDILEAYPLLTGSRFESGRQALYELWDQREGIYVPELWENNRGEFSNRNGKVIAQAYVSNLDDFESYTPVISPDGVYGAKNLIEISAGCPDHCRFCLLSHIYPAGPERSSASILKNARIFKPGEASVGLISSRVSDHPEITDVVNALASEKYTVSVSSLKVSTTSRELLEALSHAGSKSVTFAPEHGSAGIRELVNKVYSYEDVFERVRWAYESGINRVKLYFLTGFDEETDNDLDATTEFIKQLVIDTNLHELRPECRLGVGLASFVPKASTPFQRRPMQDERRLKRKIKRITEPLKNLPRIDIETESPRESIIQGMLSISDRKITDLLSEYASTRGNIASSWGDIVRAYGHDKIIDVHKPRDIGGTLPWSFIMRPKVKGREK